MDGLHSFDLTLTGEYSLCFANEFSRMSHKLIYFDVIIEDSLGIFFDCPINYNSYFGSHIKNDITLAGVWWAEFPVHCIRVKAFV